MRNFFKVSVRDRERGSLPVVLGAALLLASAGLLLAAVSVGGVKLNDAAVGKANINVAADRCESGLAALVVASDRDGAIPDFGAVDCVFDDLSTTVTVTSADKVFDADGAPVALNLDMQVAYEGRVSTSAVRSVQLPYVAVVSGENLTTDSYISGFDEEGKAIWVR